MKISSLFISGFREAFLVALVLWLSGCEYKMDCKKAHIDIKYVGYDLPELDTIIIRRYKKPYTAGNKPMDSALWIQPDHIRYWLQGDTASPGSIQKADQPFDLLLESNWDYAIFIPSSERTYRVTDIREKQTSMDVPMRCSGPKYFCMNPVEQLRINGTIGKPVAVYGRHVIYLSK
jgi:hypothetical protein